MRRMKSTKSCPPKTLIVRAGKFQSTRSSDDDCWLGKVHIVQVGAEAAPERDLQEMGLAYVGIQGSGDPCFLGLWISLKLTQAVRGTFQSRKASELDRDITSG